MECAINIGKPTMYLLCARNNTKKYPDFIHDQGNESLHFHDLLGNLGFFFIITKTITLNLVGTIGKPSPDFFAVKQLSVLAYFPESFYTLLEMCKVQISLEKEVNISCKKSGEYLNGVVGFKNKYCQ